MLLPKDILEIILRETYETDISAFARTCRAWAEHVRNSPYVKGIRARIQLHFTGYRKIYTKIKIPGTDVPQEYAGLEINYHNQILSFTHHIYFNLFGMQIKDDESIDITGCESVPDVLEKLAPLRKSGKGFTPDNIYRQYFKALYNGKFGNGEIYMRCSFIKKSGKMLLSSARIECFKDHMIYIMKSGQRGDMFYKKTSAQKQKMIQLVKLFIFHKRMIPNAEIDEEQLYVARLHVSGEHPPVTEGRPEFYANVLDVPLANVSMVISD